MKKPISLFLLSLIGISFSLSFLSAQELTPDINAIVNVPQSPEAAAFEKYGNVPVSMYTGTPQISVPLFTVQGREMNMPVSLSYDASGIKVDQMATWVGLGWNLNVGGVVTRQVAGLPDGYPTTSTGFNGKRVFDPLITNFIEYCDFRGLAVGTYHPRGVFRLWDELQNDQRTLKADLEPDIFSFNVNGLSGTIFINYAEDTAYCQSDPNIRVKFDFDASNPLVPDQLSHWTITGPDGTTYVFSAREITWHQYEHQFPNTGTFETTHEYTSAWYLTQIISPSKKDRIDLSYSTSLEWINAQRIPYRTTSKTNPINSTSLEEFCGSNATESEQGALVNEYKIRQRKLSSITVNGHKIADFIPGNTQREDLKNTYPLEEIKVYDRFGGNVANRIEFQQSYFGDPNDIGFSGAFSEERIRLKLDTVKLLGADNSDVQAQLYRFEYHDPTLLPYRDDTGVDFWGYYNGVNNSDLVPAYDDGNGTVLAGANRNPDLAKTKIGTLKKIFYPTGGHSEFEYSLHSAPPNYNTFFEEEVEGLLLVQGGENPTNPYNYCDDYFTNTFNPKGDDEAFTVYNTDSDVRLRLTILGTPHPTDFAQYVAIYKSGSGCPSPTSPICAYSAPYSFCDLFQNPPPGIIYFDDPFAGPSTYLEVSIPDTGGYRILILNADSLTTVKAELVKTVQKTAINPQTIGGLRVFKTIDRKEDGGADELTKFYYYGDYHADFASLNDYTNISPGTFSSFYASSAVIHQPLRFHNISVTYDCDGNPDNNVDDYVCNSLTRFSSNSLRSLGPHIAYSAVTEVSYSSAEGYNGFSVYNYYNEQETVGDIPFAKRKLANGEIARSRIFDKDGNLLEETQNYFTVKSIPSISSTRGLVSSSSESQAGLRYLLEQDSNVPGDISDTVLLEYVQYCTRNDGILVPNPPPCGGPILQNQTIWINRPGQPYQFNSSSNDPREYVLAEAWPGGPLIPRDGGGSEFCNPPNSCAQGVDYKFADLQVAPNTNEPVEWCGAKGTFPRFQIKLYAHSSFWLCMDSSKTVRYENGNSQSVLSENFYDRQPQQGIPGHYQLTRTKTTNSDGTVYTSKIIYPDDIDLDPTTPGFTNLALFKDAEKANIRLLGCHELHRVITPILQENYVNGIPTFLQKNTFTNLGLSTQGLSTGEIIMPLLVKTSKGDTADLKTVIQYHSYDNIGNPLEISRGQGGARIGFEWDSNKNYVIKRTDFNQTNINNYYTGPEVMETSYIYEPKFGQVSSITDPNGRPTYFFYDGFGRLTKVVDHKGNLRSLTEYNLGSQ